MYKEKVDQFRDLGKSKISTLSNKSKGPLEGPEKRKNKSKKKKIVFNLTPSNKVYTPQQLDEFRDKEKQLTNYIIENLLNYKAPSI